MKTIRIGCGAGGCTYERIEPAVELLEKGGLDYLVFECLAERTIANAQREKLKNPAKGYNPMLETRMRRLLPLAVERGVKIVSNMGGANTPAAVREILSIARELGLKGLKVAMVQGDDILERVRDYYDFPLYDRKTPLRGLDGAIISANAYLSGDPIKEALDAGADLVITGRVADPALFVGPLKHEFGAQCAWLASQSEDGRESSAVAETGCIKAQGGLLGQALLLGHLMECAGQLTGGYYADPGYKDVPDLHRLGFPIAEINSDGRLLFTKVEGSGGLVCEDVCKEQLLYEIGDPACYITPDGIADFSSVSFRQDGKDRVLASGGAVRGLPDTYKVNIGYQDCFVGEAEISYGGSNAINRARLAAEIVRKRLELTGVEPEEFRADFIGYNSLYGDAVSSRISPEPGGEIRLRIAARTRAREEAVKVVREVECLYINGPAGGGGISSKVSDVLSVENIIIPAADIQPAVQLFEV